MLRKTILFAGLGFVWLFLFSIPVGRGKSVYDIAHYYIVDTRPVHWVIGKVQGGFEATVDGAEGTAAQAPFEDLGNRLSKSDVGIESAE